MERLLEPERALNKAELKRPVLREDIELFRGELSLLLSRVNESESEEFHKNLLSDFLKRVYYADSHFINTKGRNDLVIHIGSAPTDPVGVIVEAKRPSNRTEMPTTASLDCRAIQELLLYFLRERVSHGNSDLRHLICTNLKTWFIFDARHFENLFAGDDELVRQFQDFERRVLTGTTTAFFYEHIAAPAIRRAQAHLPFVFFKVESYSSATVSEEPDARQVALFKLLSPQHLLKLPYINANNTLDKGFYVELLHIIGLEEVKADGKPVIKRKDEGKREPGSLIENAIAQIETLDKLDRVPNRLSFGATREEQLFNLALELSITWVNRILFLKLLEAQLLAFHKGRAGVRFMEPSKIGGFDDLDHLFFQVLAKREVERTDAIKAQFGEVPYLNSSLFELTELEHQTLTIGGLAEAAQIQISSSTVLRNASGERVRGSQTCLRYLLEFLASFDFAAEAFGQIQEKKRTLINAAVLGLIFEKINGYRDGSFYTPGFVTMYMAKNSVRRAVVQRFNTVKGWACETVEHVYEKINDRQEANDIVNSLTVCDPAVGSGHFLVSVLNELLAVKSELKILADSAGRRLKEYDLEVIDDEVIVTDEEGKLHEYRPNSKESQRVQEALFHEKRAIIENCLFGVDINPNSVKICRLRLWIELLKSAYYDPVTGFLETLPNIDINIKQGNSVVSRFTLEEDLRKALKRSGNSLSSYRAAVQRYRAAKTKAEKREMEEMISAVKAAYRSEIVSHDPLVKKLNRSRDELNALRGQGMLFEESPVERKRREQRIANLGSATEAVEAEIEAIRSNRIYTDAFEWRFEFPEVLDDDGDFKGFDLVIANPPYIDSEKMVRDGHEDVRRYLANRFECAKGNWDLYIVFLELGAQLLRAPGTMTYITPDKWLSKPFGDAYREKYIGWIRTITVAGRDVFENALVDSVITEIGSPPTPSLLTFSLEAGNIISLNSIAKKEIPPPCYLDPFLSAHYEFVRMLEKAPLRLRNLGEAESACATSDAYKLKPLLKSAKRAIPAESELQVINTGTIGRYSSRWGVKPMKYLKDSYVRPVVDKTEFLEAFPNSYGRRAIAKKLIVKGLTLLDATLDLRGNVVPGKTTLVVTSDTDENLKYLAALIQSPLVIFYMKARYGSASYNGGIVFTKGMLNAIPIPADAAHRDRVVARVDSILAALSEDAIEVIEELEEEINREIYKAYGLSESEIRLIKGQELGVAAATLDDDA